MQEINFRTELDGIGVELKLVPNQENQCLDLWKFRNIPFAELSIGEPDWIFLGAIKLKHIILACNRDKLSCRYGHSIEVAKRERRKQK